MRRILGKNRHLINIDEIIEGRQYTKISQNSIDTISKVLAIFNRNTSISDYQKIETMKCFKEALKLMGSSNQQVSILESLKQYHSSFGVVLRNA